MNRERPSESGIEMLAREEEIAKIVNEKIARDFKRLDPEQNIEKGQYNLNYDLSKNRVWGTIADGVKIDLTRKFETSGGVNPVDEEDLKIIEGIDRMKNPYRLEYDNISGSIGGEKINESYGNEDSVEIIKERTARYDEMRNLYLKYCAIARLQVKDKEIGGILSKDAGKTMYEIIAERKYDENNRQEQKAA